MSAALARCPLTGLSFATQDRCVLLATDIAARGLDIPGVDHVVHYQLPRAADAYVHRNGRTARAAREGFALMLCSPDEKKSMRGILSSLGRGEPSLPCPIFLMVR